MQSPTAVRFKSMQTMVQQTGIASVLALCLALASNPATASEVAPARQLPGGDGAAQLSALPIGPSSENPAVISQLLATPRIQLAILLDTSNSMDGLIEQTRNQLWQVVNEFAGAQRGGVTPILEIALFEYGNSRNARSAGYVRQLSGFTRELDAISQGLFSLTTSGGDEYCGYAIHTAIQDLQWSQSEHDIKTIFIAGNESFAQGPMPYQEAARLARQFGISINTIHAGNHAAGVDDGWQVGALLAGGEYLSIDADQQVVHIEAPQDARIAELNAMLNNTYLPYGSEGASKAQRQVQQDQQSSEISSGLLAKRARSKASTFYGNAEWDLVDAYSENKLAAQELAVMEESTLPEPMQGMSGQQKLEFLQGKKIERESIQQEIRELSESRMDYVAGKQQEQALAAPSVSDALSGAIRKQAQQKNFSFGN